MLNFIYYNPVDEKGNCVLRALTKITDKDYYLVKNEINELATNLNKNDYREVEVFEEYLRNNNIIKIDYGKDLKIKDLNLDKNKKYCIFCWDKKDFYHMVSIINNNLYDKDDKSLELYVISIYEVMSLNIEKN